MLLGDRQLAEDLVQSALIRTYATWSRLRDRDKAHAYARRIMVNLSRDWFRTHAWTHEDATDLADGDGAASPDPSAAWADRMDVKVLLQSLPPGQRSVLVLRFLEDASVQETADLMNISTGTVKSQTSAALEALRTHTELLTEGSHHD